MAILTQGVSFNFRDAKGFIGRTRFFISGDGMANSPTDYNSMAATLLAAVSNLTNASLQSVGGMVLEGELSLIYGANSNYPAEWMKAVMQFSNDKGQIGRFKIPAPKIALMDSDGVTVLNDGTQAQVVAFVNAMKNADASGTYVSNASGQHWTHFEGGLVRFGRQPKRVNERIKSSHLVAGEGE